MDATVVDPEGNDVTPIKLKVEQAASKAWPISALKIYALPILFLKTLTLFISKRMINRHDSDIKCFRFNFKLLEYLLIKHLKKRFN